jgi:hypothetical protein
VLALFGSGAAQRLDALDPERLDDRAHVLTIARNNKTAPAGVPGGRGADWSVN